MLNGPVAGEVLDEKKQHELRNLRFVLGSYYILLPLLLVYLLFKVFPPNPWPLDPETNMALNNIPIYFLRGTISIVTSLEERLLLLVIVAGALGSFIHSATSFSDYVGNRQFYPSWTLWYVLRPLIGIGLALVLYFATRGGLVLLINSGAGSIDASNINPFGVAAIAGLTGMFSKQAADKLAEVFTTLFKSSGDENRKDSLTPAPPPVIKDINPPKGPPEGGTRLTITGAGFGPGAKVVIGGLPATNIEFVNDTTIKVDTPPHGSGPVDVDLVNADGKKTTTVAGYKYVAAESANGKVTDGSATTGEDASDKSSADETVAHPSTADPTP